MSYKEAFEELRRRVYVIYRDTIVLGLRLTVEDVLEMVMDEINFVEKNITKEPQEVEE